MAMGTTQAFNVGNEYVFRVHLDTARMLADGVTPDPAWVFERPYGKEVAPVTQAAHLAKYKVEFELLAAEALAKLTPAEEISLPM